MKLTRPARISIGIIMMCVGAALCDVGWLWLGSVLAVIGAFVAMLSYLDA